MYASATNGTKVDLSEQYITQCDISSAGCNGGFPYSALLLAKNGIPLESKYPYKAYEYYQ